jgi:hypothetical protein
MLNALVNRRGEVPSYIFTKLVTILNEDLSDVELQSLLERCTVRDYEFLASDYQGIPKNLIRTAY